MKTWISVDMEGVAGVNHAGPTASGHARYPAMVDLMVGETNAAIEGSLAGGATEVVVNDSHGSMFNLFPAALHPAARVIQGQKVWSMVQGAGPEAGVDIALFVGYHARAGHPTGTIAHTYTGRLVETRLDGRPTGEYGLNALALGAWGVPVGLVSGDDALAEEVAGWLPWAERIVVKEAAGNAGAASLHPSLACDLIRAGSERAVRSAAAGELSLLRVGPPVVIEVDFAVGIHADYAALVPGSERVGDRTVRFTHVDPIDAYRAFLAGVRLAGTVD